MTVDDLRQQIEETERLIAVYRNADEVIVGTQDQIYSRRGLINHRLEAAQMLLEVAVGRLLKRQQSAVKCPVIGGYSGANVLTTRNPTL